MTRKEARQLALKRAEIIRSLARQGVRLTRSNIARALGVKNGYLDAVYQSFARHDIEGVPAYIKTKKQAQADIMPRTEETPSLFGLPVLPGTHPRGSRRIPGTNLAIYRVR